MPDFLDLDVYKTTGNISTVVVQSAFLACFICVLTVVAAYRAALKKKSANLFWLGNFALFYGIWNLLYLASYSQRDLNIANATLSATAAHRGHLIAGLLLPLLAHKFLGMLFFERQKIARLFLFTIVGIAALIFLPVERYYGWSNLLVGFFIVIAFTSLILKLIYVYRKTDNLKLKTRSYFIVVGMIVCGAFSILGQIRTEFAEGVIPLPYVGNILTAVFVYFLYQLALNPRLREIRELMLRGIRVLLLTVILSIIFISLLAWVGNDDAELFIFNTFVASFFILSVLEPLRNRIDTYFLRQFIVERYEFEELVRKLQRKLRSLRTLPELSHILLDGIRESGRIYQAGLYLWDQNARDFRLVEGSNLNFKASLDPQHPLVRQFRESRHALLMEHDQDLPADVREALRDLHIHFATPLFRQDELLGIWSLRTSFRSTNPYTSFSDPEVALLEACAQDVVETLGQLQHFESQERQKRLAALGEMSAALAHEIRNPLGAIHGACQLLETSPSLLNSEDKECVGILRKEIDRMQKTVNQYLNFARSTEEPVVVSVDTLIRKAVQEVQRKAEKTNTQIHIQIPEDLPHIVTDPLKVEQVVSNLVQNACEAFAKNVWVVGIDQGSEIRVNVKDDGPGIPAASLANVFTPLFTTKKAGSGLGLPICKKIIDSLGGSISVESKMNEGTVFSILLPKQGEKESRTVLTPSS